MELIEDGVTYQGLWPAAPDEIKQEVMALWRTAGALPKGVAPESRAAELLMIARTDNLLFGVGTCTLVDIPDLGKPYYDCRFLTLPGERHNHFATRMLMHSFDHLQAYNLSLPRPEAVGVYVLIQSRLVADNKREAIWPTTRCLYIGRSAEGWPRRIRHFDFATLST
jgi:hypothetical protein